MRILKTITSIAFLLLCLFSCADKDYFNTDDGEEYRKWYKENLEASFKENFEKVFGDILPTQSWDLSSLYTPGYARAAEGISMEAVAGLDFGIVNNVTKDNKGNYTINSSINYNKELYNDIFNTLPDNKKQTGNVAVLTAPGNGFTIFPVSAQGAYTYDMYVKVGDEPEQKVFTKDWNDYSKPFVNEMGTKTGTITETLEEDIVVTLEGIYTLKRTVEKGFLWWTTSSADYYIRGEINGSYVMTHNNPEYDAGLQWAVFSTNTGRKYLYNIGAQGFVQNESTFKLSSTPGPRLSDYSMTISNNNYVRFSKYSSNYYIGITVNSSQQKTAAELTKSEYAAKLTKVTNSKISWDMNDAVAKIKAFEGKKTTTSTSTGVTNAVSMPGIYIEAPAGTPVSIYIKNIKNGNTLVNSKNPAVGTGTGSAIVLPSDIIPEGIPSDLIKENSTIQYIGIEDNLTNGKPGGDLDFNDLVLVVIGNPYAPQPLEITNGKYTYDYTLATKRYFIEDLGSTDDFDYNDVVVDVTTIEHRVYKTTYTNGVLTKTEETDKPWKQEQSATIRALGGTLNFILQVGGTEFGKGGSTWQKSDFWNPGLMYNTGIQDPSNPVVDGHTNYYNPGGNKEGAINWTWDDPKNTFKIADNSWSPTQNNIWIKVFPNRRDPSYSSNSSNYQGNVQEGFTLQYPFPHEGDTPYIIAVDPRDEWMVERKEYTKLHEYIYLWKNSQQNP